MTRKEESCSNKNDFATKQFGLILHQTSLKKVTFLGSNHIGAYDVWQLCGTWTWFRDYNLFLELNKRYKYIISFEQICWYLTDICHVQAPLLWGVVPVGGDGGHVHAVDLPDGRVADAEEAAVGAGSHVVRTFLFGPFTVDMREKLQRIYQCFKSNPLDVNSLFNNSVIPSCYCHF